MGQRDSHAWELGKRVAVAIPCYKVKKHILQVLEAIGPEVHRIYCVDDACPEHTGDWVEQHCSDARVTVVRHDENRGVGAATLSGYKAAIEDAADVIVKIDGDSQMDPHLIRLFTEPVLAGRADYAKGNRFFNLEDTRSMPAARVIGNACLSFLTKISSGYWNIFDPTNGYTAIDARVAQEILSRRVAERYFFESDMLFHLYILRAVVTDVPLTSQYGDETSNLKIGQIVLPFLFKNLRNAFHRVIVQHFVRDFSLASIHFVLGPLAFLFGLGFGAYSWAESIIHAEPATAGTVMLSALPLLFGTQLLLGAINYDMQSVPEYPRQHQLREQDLLSGWHTTVPTAAEPQEDQPNGQKSSVS